MIMVGTARLMIKLLVAFVAGGAVLLGSAADSQAAFKMRLTQGANVVVITDDGALDSAEPAVDNITYLSAVDGAIGTFTLISATGITGANVVDPIMMDLNSVQTASATGGTLVLELTETDFSFDSAFKFFVGGIGGTAGTAVISYEVFIDTSNSEFGTGGMTVTKVIDISGLAGVFAAVDSGLAAADAAYSITQVVTIVCAGACTSSFDATIEMPEPATLALFGMGLLMFGLVARRQRKFGPTRGA